MEGRRGGEREREKGGTETNLGIIGRQEFPVKPVSIMGKECGKDFRTAADGPAWALASSGQNFGYPGEGEPKCSDIRGY